jgi:hypothetical protein
MALEEGLISFDTAFDELFGGDEPSIDFTLLRRFAKAVPDTAAADRLSSFLGSFEGTLTRDADGDGIIEYRVEYSGGVPVSISYDRNQDGSAEAEAVCEYGLPASVYVSGAELTFYYDAYPSVFRVESADAAYTLVPGVLRWAPFSVEAADLAPLVTSFVFPLPDESSGLPSERAITAFASAAEMPDRRSELLHPGARIRYSLFRGQPVSAVSTVNGTPFAYLVYEKGVLRFRNIDEDGDGFYETTEVYRFIEGKGASLSQTLVDLDKDGYPEYSEEYTEDNRRIAGWDLDGDGVQESVYIRHNDGTEESFFVHPSTGEIIGIQVVAAIPVSVTISGKTLFITQDAYNEFFYWIGAEAGEAVSETGRNIIVGRETIAEKLIELYSRNGVQGVPALFEIDGADILVFPSGSFYFGEMIREK